MWSICCFTRKLNEQANNHQFFTLFGGKYCHATAGICLLNNTCKSGCPCRTSLGICSHPIGYEDGFVKLCFVDVMVSFLNSSSPGRNGRHFAYDIFICIFVYEKFCILLKLVPKGPNDNNIGLDWIMAWCRIGDKPLSEPMLTRICIYQAGRVCGVWCVVVSKHCHLSTRCGCYIIFLIFKVWIWIFHVTWWGLLHLLWKISLGCDAPSRLGGHSNLARFRKAL